MTDADDDAFVTIAESASAVNAEESVSLDDVENPDGSVDLEAIQVARAAKFEKMLKQAIVCVGDNQYHIMKRNGHYDTRPVTRANIPARIKDLGMDWFLPIVTTSAKGELKHVPPEQLVTDHTTFATHVHGVSGTKGDPKGRPKGCWLAPNDLDGVNERVLMYPLYGLRSLAPVYSKLVDEWLGYLVGVQNKQRIEEWIAHSLDLGKPICALSLAGPPSCGKKMLAQGLAECITSQDFADGEELTARFQYSLLRSPFLVVDEGLAESGQGRKHAADVFRQMLAGGTLTVDRKNREPIRITTPIRFLFTANNTDTVKSLVGQRNLSPDDRDALAIRLLHLDARREAATWLAARGGFGFTAAPGARWIRGDGGEQSDAIVAKHFMYLHANRGPAPGKRFLVEGDVASSLALEIRTQSGDAPAVLEAVVGMCNSAKAYDGFVMSYDAVSGEPMIHALPSEVLKFMRGTNPASAARANTKKIGSVFRGFAYTNHKSYPHRHALRPALGTQKWYELHPATVLQAAQSEGWVSSRLVQLAEGGLRCNTKSPRTGAACWLIGKHPGKHVAPVVGGVKGGRVSWL